MPDEGGLKGSICPLLFFFSAGGFFKSRIIQEKLITSFVPFLPLSRRHVERCVHSQLCLEGLCSRNDVVEAVGGDMTYTPVQGHFFSTTGCKAVPAKINLFLWVEEQRIVKRKGGNYLWKDNGLCIWRCRPHLGAPRSKQIQSQRHILENKEGKQNWKDTTSIVLIESRLFPLKHLCRSASYTPDRHRGRAGFYLKTLAQRPFSWAELGAHLCFCQQVALET